MEQEDKGEDQEERIREVEETQDALELSNTNYCNSLWE